MAKEIEFNLKSLLLEYLNMNELEELCKYFSIYSQTNAAIIDLANYSIITSTNNVCTCFLKKTPFKQYNREKSISFTENSLILLSSSYDLYQCHKNFIDVVVPIQIGDETVALFYMGQFLFGKPETTLNNEKIKKSYQQNIASDGMIFSEFYITKMLDFLNFLIYNLGKIGTYRKQFKETKQQQEQEKAAFLESEERLRFVMEGSKLGFWDWNLVTGEVIRNKQWANMLGYTFEEIQFTTKQWEDFLHPDDREAAWQSINDHLNNKTPIHEIEYRMLTKEGSYKWILDRAMVTIRDLEGNALRMSGTHDDITERKNIEKQLIYMGNYDKMTGLYSRTFFENECKNILNKNCFPIGIIVADLDNLKQTNDTFGHIVGDELIKNSAMLLKNSANSKDIVARTGGDEFIILIYGADLAILKEYLKRIRKLESVANKNENNIPIKISLGTAIADNSSKMAEALRQADDAMYRNKKRRKKSKSFATNSGDS